MEEKNVEVAPSKGKKKASKDKELTFKVTSGQEAPSNFIKGGFEGAPYGRYGRN
jgi:hypothetical protein